MNERLEHLRATVRELERELTEVESLDADTRQALAQAAADIHAALGQSAPAATDESLNAPGVTQKLRDVAAEFESSHPTLAGVLERVIDALGQFGI